MNAKTDLLALLPLLIIPMASPANQYIFEPEFSLQERYEDNLRMRQNPERTHFITTLSPALKFGIKKEATELIGNFKWNELFYHSQPSLDISEQLLNATFRHIGERTEFQLNGHYNKQSSLSTELDISGSGILDTQVKRTSAFISPSFSYQTTERSSIQLNYSYADVEFGESSDGNNSNYTNQQFSLSGLYQLTERNSVNLGASFTIFESPVNNQISETTNFQLGWQHQYSERLQFGLSAGLRNTSRESEFSGFKFKSDNEGKTFAANISYANEWGRVNFNASQQLTPASTGGQQESTSFSLSSNYNISERWTSSLNVLYYINESAGSTNQNKRTFFHISPRLSWRWTDEISLSLAYNYRRQKFDRNNLISNGNTVSFQFVYQPQINNQVK